MILVSLIFIFWAVFAVLIFRWSAALWKKCLVLALVVVTPILLFVIWSSGVFPRMACAHVANELAVYHQQNEKYPEQLSELSVWGHYYCDYHTSEDLNEYFMTFYAGGFSLGIYKNGELFFD